MPISLKNVIIETHKEKIMNAPVDWLLEGELWIEYRTRRDLLWQSETDSQVRSARTSMMANSQVQSLIADFSG
jgi:hypothetical protein